MKNQKTQKTKYKQDTIFNIQKNPTKYLGIVPCILFVSCALFLASSAPAEAQSNIVASQLIAKSALESGYIAETPDKDASIVIAPHSFNRSVFFELIEPEYHPSIPLDKDKISKIYHYAILPATDNELWSPIAIKLQYPETETRWREIFIYNEEIGAWQHIEGSIDLTNHYLSIQTKQASGFVAVLADHLDKSEYAKAKLNTPTILVANAKTGEILIERNSGETRPIASLTKLMTAAVFLDNNPGWEKRVTMQAADDTIPAKIYVKAGDVLTARSLFYSTLLPSANNAARALARSTGLSEERFVEEMNKKAKELGMNSTHYEEVTGLSEKNVSTAQDYLILTKKLFANPLFLQATTPKYFTIATVNGGKKQKLQNTNKILDVPYVVIGSKTGYTYEAGRCLAMKVRNKSGLEIMAITLGADKPGAQWEDMRTLLDASLAD